MTGGPAACVRVLVVVAVPDQRPSTLELQRQVEALTARPGVRCEVWFLRDYHGRRWPGSRSVDELRTWWGSRALTAVGLGRLAGLLRGLRLRSWQRALDPDVVVLDDGYGERVLDGIGRRPAVVVRRNEVRGDTYGFDEGWRAEGDVTVSSAHDLDRAPPGWLVEPERLDLEDRASELAPALVDARRPPAVVRAELGLEGRDPLVIGWGDDGWVDGATAFVRALWFLEHRHGVVAHGAWFGPMDDAEELDQLRSEAALCGLSERLVLFPPSARQAHWCGDLALLPWRVPPGPDEVLLSMGCRVPLVAFGPLPLDVPWCIEAPVLDVPALAARAAVVLTGGVDLPEERWRLGRTRAEHLDAMLDAALGCCR